MLNQGCRTQNSNQSLRCVFNLHAVEFWFLDLDSNIQVYVEAGSLEKLSEK
jgi:ribosomal protein L28